MQLIGEHPYGSSSQQPDAPSGRASVVWSWPRLRQCLLVALSLALLAATLAIVPASVASAQTTTLPQVTGVNLVADGPNQLTVTWNQAAGATGYKVQWRTGRQDWDAASRQRAVTGGDTLTDTIPDLEGSVSYSVRVIATGSGGTEGAPSGIEEARALFPSPSQPTGVTVRPFNTRAWLVTWPSPRAGIDEYEIRYQIEGAREIFRTIRSGDLRQHIITAASVTERATKSIQVSVRAREYDSFGSQFSPYSDVVTAPAGTVGAAGPVSRITATQDGGNIEVSWSGGGGVHLVYWTRLSGSRATPEFIRHAPKSTNARTVTLTGADGITVGDGYRVWVLNQEDGKGLSPLARPAYAEVRVEHLPKVTGVRVDGSAVPYQIAVSWQQARGATAYKVQWRSGDQDWDADARQHTVDGGDTLTATIGDLVARRLYFLRVIAAGTGGIEGEPSDVAFARPVFPDPVAPTNVRARPFGTDGWLVTWTPSVTPGVYRYEILYGHGSIFNIKEVTGDLTEQVITASSANERETTAFEVSVRAISPPLSVRSEYSSYSNPGTAAAGAVGAASPVSGIAAAQFGNRVDVSWTAAADADGYRVYWTRLSGSPEAPEFIRHGPEVVSGGSNTTAMLTEADGITAGEKYRVWVLATESGKGDSAFADPAYADATVASANVLTGLRPTSAAADSISVEWAAATGATQYRVRWKPADAAGFAPADVRTTTGTSYTVPSLSATTLHDIEVAAIIGGSRSDPDGPAAQIQATTVPALANLSARPAAGDATALDVSWTPQSGAAGYVVQWKSGTQSYSSTARTGTVPSGSAGAYQITGLSPDTAYDVRVTARYTTVGRSYDGASATDGATTHRELAGLRVDRYPGVTTDLDVAWTAVAGASAYRVQWKTGDESYSTSQRHMLIPTTGMPEGVTVATAITGLLAGTAYDVRVTARVSVDGTTVDGDAGEAGGTTAATAADTFVAGFMVRPVAGSPTSLAASWTAYPGAERYEVRYLEGTSGLFVTSADDVTGTSRTIDGLEPNTPYTVAIRAVDTGTDPDSVVAWQNTMAITLDDLGDVTVTAVPDDGTKLTASWDDIAGESGYRVEWKLDTAPSYPSDNTYTTAAGATSHTIEDLALSTAYDVRVTAVVPDGASTLDGDSSEGSGTTSSIIVVPRVTGVSVPVPTAANQLTVSWDGFPSASGYKVQWKSGAEDWDATARQRAVDGGDTLTASIGSLEGGVTYDIRVIATQAGQDDSAPSDTASQKALHPAPAPPTNVAVSPVGTDGWLVTWTPSPTPGVTRYDIDYMILNSPGDPLSVTSGDLTQQVVTPPAFLRRFAGIRDVIVRAVRPDSVGTGDSQAADHAPATGAANPVSNIAAAQLGDGIEVSWTAATDADGYKVFWTRLSGSPEAPEFIQHAPKVITGGANTGTTLTAADGIAAGKYRVWVLATESGEGDSDFADPAHADAAFDASKVLTGLAPTAAGTDSITVSWDEAAGVAGYRVRWKPATANGFADADAGTTTGTSFTAPDLSATTLYDIEVAAYTTGNSASPDGPADGIQVATVPELAGLTVANLDDRSDNTLTVTWTPQPGAASYLLQWKSGSSEQYSTTERFDTVSPGTVGAYRLTGLDGNTRYEVQVTARYTTGGHTYDGDSDTAGATTHPSLAGVTVEAVADSAHKLLVRWQEPPGSIGYEVQWRSGDQDYSELTRIDQVTDFRTLQYEVGGLSPGVTYHIRVASIERDEVASYPVASSEASGVPRSLVTGLAAPAAAGTANGLDVSWQAGTGAAGFRVEWKLKTAADYADADTLTDGTARSHTIAGLVPNTAYDVRVTSIVSVSGVTVDSHSATTEGITHRELTGLRVHPWPGLTDTLDATWNAVPGAVGYRVQWKTGDQGYSTSERSVEHPATGVPGGAQVSHSIASLDANTDYDLRVTALVTVDGQTVDGDAAEAGGTTNATNVDGLVADFVVRPVEGSPTSLAASWTAFTGAARYEVRYVKGNEALSITSADDITGTSHTIGGLEPDTGYSVFIRAFDGADPATPIAWRASLSVYTLEEMGEVTVTPVADAPDELSVGWDDLGRETGYRVDWKLSSAAEFPAGTTDDAPANTTSYTIDGLEGGTAYDVRVTALVVIGDDQSADGDSSQARGTTIAEPAVVVGAEVVTLSESGTGTYQVWLATQPSGNVTVTPASDTTSAATVSDPLTFTTSNWGTPQTVTVTGVDDRVDNPGGARTATISHTVSDYDAVTAGPTLRADIVDDDGDPGVWVSPTAVTVREVDDPATTAEEHKAAYTVMLTQAPPGDVSVRPAFINHDREVEVTPSQVDFTASNWSTPQQVTITARDNSFYGDRTVPVTHGVTGYGAVTTAPGVTVTILSDDPRSVVSAPGITIDPAEVVIIAEADDPDTAARENEARFTVRLNRAPLGQERLQLRSGDDFVAVSPVGLTFDRFNATTPRTVTVRADSDDIDNPGDMRDTVIWVERTNGQIVGSIPVVVTDDDPLPPDITVAPRSLSVAEDGGTATYTVRLDTVPTGDVTVTVTSSLPSAATVDQPSLTFTAADWNTPQTVTVTGVDDDRLNATNKRSATISHTASGGGYGSVTAPDVSVTVTDDDVAALTALTAAAAADDGTKLNVWWDPVTGAERYLVQWKTAGEEYSLMQGRAALVSALGNPAPGHLITRLTEGTTYDVRVTAQSGQEFNETLTDHAQGETSGTTLSLADGVSVSPPEVTVREADAPSTVVEENKATYTVVLDWAPSGTVTVTPTSSDDVNDATVAPPSLTFSAANWNVPQRVTVTAVDEAFYGDRTATISHAVEGHGAVTTGPEVTVSVLSDDPRTVVGSGVTISPAAVPAVVEADDPATPFTRENETTFAVRLNAAPNGTVTIAIESDAPGIATAIPVALTFTTSDWNVERAVTVTGQDDDIDNLDDQRAAVVSLTATGPGLGGRVVARVPVTVTDDDATAALEGLKVLAEEGSPTSLMASWDAAAGANVYWVRFVGVGGIRSGPPATTPLTSLRLSGLSPDTGYTVEVLALDTTVDPVAVIAGGTASGTTLEQFGAVTVTPVAFSRAHLDVSWTDLDRETGYVVRWKLATESDSAYGPSRSYTASEDATSHRIGGLSPGTAYDVRVTPTVVIDGQTANGHHSTGRGTTVDEASVWVASLSVDRSDDEVLDVSWPVYSGALKYRVQWKSGDQQFSTSERSADVTDGSATGHEVGGLAPGTRYTVRVTVLGPSDAVLATSSDLSATRWGLMEGMALRPEPGDARAMRVSWGRSAGAAGYVVEWKRSTDAAYPASNRAGWCWPPIWWRRRGWTPASATGGPG